MVEFGTPVVTDATLVVEREEAGNKEGIAAFELHEDGWLEQGLDWAVDEGKGETRMLGGRGEE